VRAAAQVELVCPSLAWAGPGADELEGTADDCSSAQTCEVVKAAGIFDLPLDCYAAAQSCEAVEACE